MKRIMKSVKKNGNRKLEMKKKLNKDVAGMSE